MHTNQNRHLNKLIIIIIMLLHQHGYPRPSIATPPNRPLLPAGLQSYIPYWHGAAVWRFGLVVLLLLVHVKISQSSALTITTRWHPASVDLQKQKLPESEVCCSCGPLRWNQRKRKQRQIFGLYLRIEKLWNIVRGWGHYKSNFI